MYVADSGEDETAGASQEAPLVPIVHSKRDFLLEQYCDDTLVSQRPNDENCQEHDPDITLIYLHFVFIRD